MIYLAIAAEGLRAAVKAAAADDAIWCGCDAISAEDYARLDRVNVSRFVYELGDRAMIGTALTTIEEHHPGQSVWIEAPKSAL